MRLFFCSSFLLFVERVVPLGQDQTLLLLRWLGNLMLPNLVSHVGHHKCQQNLYDKMGNLADQESSTDTWESGGCHHEWTIWRTWRKYPAQRKQDSRNEREDPRVKRSKFGQYIEPHGEDCWNIEKKKCLISQDHGVYPCPLSTCLCWIHIII
mgnify:CR=1 FL=1